MPGPSTTLVQICQTGTLVLAGGMRGQRHGCGLVLRALREGQVLTRCGCRASRGRNGRSQPEVVLSTTRQFLPLTQRCQWLTGKLSQTGFRDGTVITGLTGMAEQTQTAEGGCMCGTIRFKATGAPEGSGYCHCHSCRHHSGAPVVAFVGFTAEHVEWLSGDRARYESSPGIFRAFCRDCGTSLTWEGRKLVEFHISSLDDPDEFPPNEHTYYSERISWLHITDELVRYPASIV